MLVSVALLTFTFVVLLTMFCVMSVMIYCKTLNTNFVIAFMLRRNVAKLEASFMIEGLLYYPHIVYFLLVCRT